jgi:hypothetical protein
MWWKEANFGLMSADVNSEPKFNAKFNREGCVSFANGIGPNKYMEIRQDLIETLKFLAAACVRDS